MIYGGAAVGWASRTTLNTCNANLETCTTDLGLCTTDLGTCTADLTQAQAELGTCAANLTTCQADLAACQAVPQAVFPGDGVTGPALSYQDNGDGTITDLNTGLMWEQKVAGGGTCLDALHAVDAVCSWFDATGAWISAVNAEGYAGHSDWRLPNIKELQSIVDYGTVNPAIDSTFSGVTAASSYWSSTSHAAFPTGAWFVFFDGGGVLASNKVDTLRVRAVRGGQ